ncbi:unnamed protein product [Phytophthora fragariaefolia]|uniref:Carboxypeptidase n=1 Tax=Phytophthora fragariaefolia TaxID=1490495 RepID=A0A9W6Y920_9STRA|nr:unnamed protein product [Phytophthora fragariaefolia]
MSSEVTPLVNGHAVLPHRDSFESVSSVRSYARVHKLRVPPFALFGAVVLLLGVNLWRAAIPNSPANELRAKPILVTTSNGVQREHFCASSKQDSGYIKLPNKIDDRYFFWYFEARRNPKTAPLVLWLTGGPGGPANVVWLDQPTNVGFSFGPDPQDADDNEDNVAENIYWFLQGFLARHPELQGREFFISGESYGGHYVPAAAYFISKQNRQTPDGAILINLQGISIGNGCTNPAIQNPHFIDMAANEYNISLVNPSEMPALKEAAKVCGQKMEECQLQPSLCFKAEAYCEEHLDNVFVTAKRNPYDIRKACPTSGTDVLKCIASDFIAPYLNSPNLRNFLHVDDRVGDWQMFNFAVNSAFADSYDVMMSTSSYVADLLDDGVRVLIYAGDADLECNWSGNLAWLQALEWTGASAFNDAQLQDMVVDDDVAGSVVAVDRLTFIRVFNAGHMVPQDQPAAFINSLKMSSPQESTPLVGADAAPTRRDVLAYRCRLVAVLLAFAVFLGCTLVDVPSDAELSLAADQSYLCDPTSKQDAGYVKLENKIDDYYFYWYFESRRSPATDPLVLWLTGGPGGSSIMAMLAENGPCKILPGITPETNLYSWTNQANVVWLDQPTSVGFSYGSQQDKDFNETNVGENIFWFLHGFLEKHPELEEREFFVTGESYGGHYVPVAAHYIWKKNQASPASLKLDIQGVTIGNGLTNPIIQVCVCLKRDQCNVECVDLTQKCQLDNTNRAICSNAQGCWKQKLIAPFEAAQRNRYDIRQPCYPDFPLCYNFSHIHAYLDSARVREMLHVDQNLGPWLEINNDVFQTFVTDGDWSMSYDTYIADLLNDDLRVLIYAGDADIMCNWMGNQAWTLALDWRGKDSFNAAEEQTLLARDPLMYDGAKVSNAGVVRSFNNCALVRLDLFNRFLAGSL